MSFGGGTQFSEDGRRSAPGSTAFRPAPCCHGGRWGGDRAIRRSRLHDREATIESLHHYSKYLTVWNASRMAAGGLSPTGKRPAKALEAHAEPLYSWLVGSGPPRSALPDSIHRSCEILYWLPRRTIRLGRPSNQQPRGSGPGARDSGLGTRSGSGLRLGAQGLVGTKP